MKRLISVVLVMLVLCGSCMMFGQTAFAATPSYFEGIADTFNSMSTDDFTVNGKYFEDANCIVVSLKYLDVDSTYWRFFPADAKYAVKDAALGVYEYDRFMLDEVGATDTRVIVVCQLNDGNVVCLMVDGVDISSMISS